MKIKIILLFFLSSFLYCCIEKQKDENNTISVDLDQKQNVSIFNIFSKIDIIPLETNDSSLIKFISKLVVYHDNFYILDDMSKIITFTHDGKFLFQINNKGIGPDEYIGISDFDIYSDSLSILSGMDSRMHIYDNKGNFIRRFKLPNIKKSYESFKNVNKDTVAFWTYDYENRLKLYSKSTKQIFKEKMPEKNDIYTYLGIQKFPYENYIPSVNDNRVFKITSQSEIIEAYKWDFGKLNNTPKMIENPPVLNSQNESRELINKIMSSEVINYVFLRAGGNSRYTYTKLNRKNAHINVFYDKFSKKTYVFEKTTEKVQIYPLCWTDSYMIGWVPEKVSVIDDVIPDIILNKGNILIKNKLSQFDNPILIKYYFKK